MTPAILLLLAAIVLKGVVALIPAVLLPATVLGWVVSLFLAFSVVADLFYNAPRFLLRQDHGILAEQTRDWQLRYVFVMGLSMFIRVITILVLVQWFLFPSARIFSL